MLHHLKSERDVAQKEGRRLQEAATKVTNVSVCVCRAYVVYIEIFERDVAQKEGRRLPQK
jgi:hypothetical protein